MYKLTLEKTDEMDTPIGRASILHIGKQRLLSFPSFIDKHSKVSLRTYYGTLVWPADTLIDNITHFPSGPSLPGYLLLSIEEIFTTVDKTVNRSSTKRPRHIRTFVGNVLAELAATLIANQ